MMRTKTILEFLPIDAFEFFMSFNISIPPICSGTHQLVQSKQNLLPVITLNHLQLLLNYLQPVISIHWFDGVRECWRLGPLKLSKLVTRLGLWRWMMSLSLVHVGHSLLHGLQHLSLHYQNLLKCWWWRRVGIAVVVVLIVIGTTVASVGHLMIVKRFEIELKIEIQDSQLYASRYTDDYDFFIYITKVRL
jgi:hypothetical protein